MTRAAAAAAKEYAEMARPTSATPTPRPAASAAISGVTTCWSSSPSAITAPSTAPGQTNEAVSGRVVKERSLLSARWPHAENPRRDSPRIPRFGLELPGPATLP